MKMNLLSFGYELIPIDDGAFDLLSFRSEIPVGTVFPDGEIFVAVGSGFEVEASTARKAANNLIILLEEKAFQ